MYQKNVDMFFRPQKRRHTEKTWPSLESPFCALGLPKLLQGPIPIQKVGPKGAHSEFWRGAEGSELRYPVCAAKPARVRLDLCGQVQNTAERGVWRALGSCDAGTPHSVSSWHFLATMTASADEGGCQSELSRSVRVTLSESRTDVCFSLWHVADHLPCAVNVGSRERERVRESERVREPV